MTTKLEQQPLVQELAKNLQRMGIALRCFDTPEEAADYLDGAIDGVSVGIGGSMTVKELGLYPRLCAHNQVFGHWEGNKPQDAVGAEVYICSVNGLAATGEIVNIDGTCNRVAATLYGHKRLYYVVGINKLEPDLEKALWRARNIAAPLNAKRLDRKTPCAVKGDRCYNCSSPDKVCRAFSVLAAKSDGIGQTELVLIGARLGY